MLTSTRLLLHAFVAQVAKLNGLPPGLTATPGQLAEFNVSPAIEQKLQASQRQLTQIQVQFIDPEAAQSALAAFGPIWEQLAPREQARLIELLVERIEYDGRAQSVSITFHPSGITTLAQEQEMAA